MAKCMFTFVTEKNYRKSPLAILYSFSSSTDVRWVSIAYRLNPENIQWNICGVPLGICWCPLCVSRICFRSWKFSLLSLLCCDSGFIIIVWMSIIHHSSSIIRYRPSMNAFYCRKVTIFHTSRSKIFFFLFCLFNLCFSQLKIFSSFVLSFR